MKDPFKLNVSSLMALYELFPTEEACIKHLEAINWHGKPVSPFDKTSKVYKLRSGKYRCKNTGQNFTVRTGTMFEKTKISLFGLSLTISLDFILSVGKPYRSNAKDGLVYASKDKAANVSCQRIHAEGQGGSGRDLYRWKE